MQLVSREKLADIYLQRSRASLFVDFAGDEMMFLVEMVVDLSMN
jgi:hypothetical protein